MIRKVNDRELIGEINCDYGLKLVRRYLRTEAVPGVIFSRDMLAYWALALARWTALASTADTLLKLLAKISKIKRLSNFYH